MKKMLGGNQNTVYQESQDSLTPTSYKAPMLAGGKKKRSTTKKGGDLISDVKGLAVPFAILLAKQGLEMAMDKKKKTAKAEATKPKPKAMTRRKTVAGGSDCTTCAKKGGSDDIKLRFTKLSKEIDDFLKKY